MKKYFSISLVACAIVLALFGLNCQRDHTETSTGKPKSAIDNLLESVKEGKIESVKEYIEQGGDVNAQDNAKQFALLAAIWNKRNDITKYLLQHGANPNLTDMTGQSPVFVAAYEQNLEILQELIAHKADVNIVTGSGETALLRAVAWQNPTITSALLKAGADPDKVSDKILLGVGIKSREEWNKLIKELTQ